MNAPSGLDPAARAAWKRAVRVLESIGADVELNDEPLRQFAVASGELAALRRALAEDGRLVVKSAHGGLVAHPLIAAIEKQARLVSDLSGALGLDAPSRRKLGMHFKGGGVMGGHTAPDRKVMPRGRGKVTAIHPELQEMLDRVDAKRR